MALGSMICRSCWMQQIDNRELYVIYNMILIRTRRAKWWVILWVHEWLVTLHLNKRRISLLYLHLLRNLVELWYIQRTEYPTVPMLMLIVGEKQKHTRPVDLLQNKYNPLFFDYPPYTWRQQSRIKTHPVRLFHAGSSTFSYPKITKCVCDKTMNMEMKYDFILFLP